jgi:hypothetical protein
MLLVIHTDARSLEIVPALFKRQMTLLEREREREREIASYYIGLKRQTLEKDTRSRVREYTFAAL